MKVRLTTITLGYINYRKKNENTLLNVSKSSIPFFPVQIPAPKTTQDTKVSHFILGQINWLYILFFFPYTELSFFCNSFKWLLIFFFLQISSIDAFLCVVVCELKKSNALCEFLFSSFFSLYLIASSYSKTYSSFS